MMIKIRLLITAIVCTFSFMTMTCAVANEKLNLKTPHWKIPSVSEKNAMLPAYQVVKVINLAKSKNKDLYIRLIILDNGLSTDHSPRYQLFLSYFHANESHNSYSLFNLGYIEKLDSYKRLRAGVYQVYIRPFNSANPEMQPKMITIDTLPVFLADKTIKKEELNDYYLNSFINVYHYLPYRGWSNKLNKYYKLKQRK